MKHPLHVFVPSPNDNYSPNTGSANITRLYEISRRHIARGGRALFIMGRESWFDYPTGDCIRVDYPPQLNARQRQRDLLNGWLGKPREFRAARYRPAASALDPHFDGPVFLYNDAAALAPFHERCERAKLILYCGNQIWTSFSRREMMTMMQLATRVICISEFLAGELRRRLRLSCSRREYSELAPKIVAIANGVNIEQFHPPETKPQNDVPVILFIGRIQPVKGAHLLIKASQLLHETGRQFLVRIVGSRAFSPDAPLTPYEEQLREQANPIQKLVEFHPFVNREQIADEYRRADIFCMPSVWREPFGLTLLEGMASGLPTVASNRGGIPEAGGDAVRYFQPPKVRELAAQLSHFIDDEEERIEWGKKARRRAEEYSWDRHYDSLTNTLDSIR